MRDSAQILQKKQVSNEVRQLDQLQYNLYTILHHLKVTSCAKSQEELSYSKVKIGL